MISSRLAGAFAAGALAVGLVAGSVGTIVADQGTTPSAIGPTACATRMGVMMSMMDDGSSMMDGVPGMGPIAPVMPDWMLPHHQITSPAPSR